MTFYIIAESSTDPEYHLTLAPGFEAQPHSDLGGVLNVVANSSTIQIIPSGLSQFATQTGDRVSVLKILRTDQIKRLHEILAWEVFTRGEHFVEPRFVYDGFHPHITGANMTTVFKPFDTIKLTQYSDGTFSTRDEVTLRSRNGNH